MICPVCGTEAIAGIDHCVNCGEPLREIESGYGIVILGQKTPAEIAEREINASAKLARRQRMTEARSLEIVGDLDKAIKQYEDLIDGGYDWPDAFQRLAIVYKRAKRPADEERIVRVALSRLNARCNGWFILRLATIIAKQKKAGK